MFSQQPFMETLELLEMKAQLALVHQSKDSNRLTNTEGDQMLNSQLVEVSILLVQTVELISKRVAQALS